MNHIFIAPDKRKAEVDVLAVRRNHSVTAIECKGYSPRATISDDLFKRWLQHNVPVSFKAMRDHPDYKNLPVTFEFWTTAPISHESLTLYKKVKSELNENRYKIELRSPHDVAGLCYSTYEQSLITAFEKHFMMEDGSTLPVAREPKPAPADIEDISNDLWD